MRKNMKGQMKIQEMAFVLVAIMIFFGMVALVFFSISLSNLKTESATQRQELAKEVARKLADIPEFSAGCTGCIDLEKVLAVKNMKIYKNFWDIDYLMVEITYPNKTNRECTEATYPNCNTIIVVNNTKSFGTTSTAFVAICGFAADMGGNKCELGRIHAAGKVIK